MSNHWSSRLEHAHRLVVLYFVVQLVVMLAFLTYASPNISYVPTHLFWFGLVMFPAALLARRDSRWAARVLRLCAVVLLLLSMPAIRLSITELFQWGINAFHWDWPFVEHDLVHAIAWLATLLFWGYYLVVAWMEEWTS